MGVRKMDAEELQLCFSFQNITAKQVAFWNKRGVTFTEIDGKVVPVVNK